MRLASSARRLPQRLLVEREQRAIAHQPAAVAHDVDHVGRLRGVDDLRIDAVGVAAERRHVVHGPEIDHDQVGAFAGFERAGQVIHVHRAGADPRGHRQRLPRRDRRGIAARALRQERGQARFLEHVEVVVGRRTVRADADVQPELQHARHRRDAGGELQVARRVVRDPGVGVLHLPHLAFVHVHAVRGQHLRVEEPLLLHPGHHRHAVLLARVVHLLQRFGEMDVQRHVELRRELGARAQDFGRARVRRVRRGRRDDQRVVAPALDEVARTRQRVLEARRVRRGKAEHRLRAQRAHAGCRRGLGHRFLEVVHVGEAGDARSDHLGAARAACPAGRTRG